MDYSNLPRHDVICIDMKSFYASCEAVLRGLNPLTAKIVVVGDINRNGSVVLAASPVMKKQYNIRTGSRLFEVKKIKDKNIIIAQARMDSYLKTSKQIVQIFERFVPPNAIHVYSVDESWLTLDGTKRLWGDAWEASEIIKKTIYDETGLICGIGIGDNKFLAKFCLDVYGKFEGISEARYEQVVELFHHLPVKRMWGIGDSITKRLSNQGIETVGDLAQTNIQRLKNEFGITGEHLWYHAWGIDFEPVIYNENSPPPSAFGFFNDDSANETIKSVGRGVTLLRDYKDPKEITLVVLDLVQEVCEVLRKKKLEGKTVHLSVGYSKIEKTSGFSRQISFKNSRSNDIQEIYMLCEQIFKKFYLNGSNVRQLRVSISSLDKEALTLLDDDPKSRRRKALETMDNLNNKWGKGKVRTASSLLESSIAKSRIDKIGGHTK